MRYLLVVGLVGLAAPVAAGVQMNGVQMNGVQMNGVQMNGVQMNGVQMNGVQMNGVQMNGTQLSGSFIGFGSSSFPYSCSHSEGVTGTALNNCSPCSQIVADADPYCRNNYWDSLCVSRANTMCRATITTGSTLPLSNGSSLTISARNQVGWTHNGTQWLDHSDVWYNTLNWKIAHAPNVVGVAMSASTPSQCVKAVVAADPYCGNNYWDSLCVQQANSLCTSGVKAQQRTVAYGDSACGYDGNSNAIQGLFVQGIWDQRQGVQGGGAKIASSPSGAFSIACRGVGAIAKCIDYGYRPWVSAADDTLHQSCVRMVRDDLCGDGTSWTANGNQIDVADYRNTQTHSTDWSFDAVWTPNGAPWIAWWGGGRATGQTTWSSDLANYKNTHAYCQTQPWHPYSAPASALTLDGNPNQLKTKRVYTCNSTMCQ